MANRAERRALQKADRAAAALEQRLLRAEVVAPVMRDLIDVVLGLRLEMHELHAEIHGERHCESCGKVLLPGRSDKRFCDDTCAARKRRALQRDILANSERVNDLDEDDEPSDGGYLDTDWLRVKPGDQA